MSAADEIDAIIAAAGVGAGGWKGETLAELRRVILDADREIVEAIKWRKPSRPEGVATWMLAGNVCMADVLKNAVRLTFPKGAAIEDPTGLFNRRLDSATVRAVDVGEGERLDDEALDAIVRAAVALDRAG